MASLELIAPRVPLTDPRTGLISREWYRFFQALYSRVGGPIAETPNEIAQDMAEDGGVEELKATAYAIEQQFGQLPRSEPVESFDHGQAPKFEPIEQVQALEQQLAALRDEVAEVRKQLQALHQGVLL